MPKCRKRIVCKHPDTTIFVPHNNQDCEILIMSVDEYESIRLIDLEGHSQEECAKKLGVARTTAQLIYNKARQKLAKTIVYGLSLQIEGGNYEICDGSLQCQSCHLNEQIEDMSVFIEKTDGHIRIAITYEDGQVFQHFGRSEMFKVYDVVNHMIISSKVISSNGKAHGDLVKLLTINQVDILICGKIGAVAKKLLEQADIPFYSGVVGQCDEVVENYLKQSLLDQ